MDSRLVLFRLEFLVFRIITDALLPNGARSECGLLKLTYVEADLASNVWKVLF